LSKIWKTERNEDGHILIRKDPDLNSLISLVAVLDFNLSWATGIQFTLFTDDPWNETKAIKRSTWNRISFVKLNLSPNLWYSPATEFGWNRMIESNCQ
jgi:hypothetical protein